MLRARPLGTNGSLVFSVEKKTRLKRQEAVVSALAVITKVNNKHSLLQPNVKAAAHTIFENLGDVHVLEKIREKKGLIPLIKCLEFCLQYIASNSSLISVSVTLHKILWSLTAHRHFAKACLKTNLAAIVLEELDNESKSSHPFFECDKPLHYELIAALGIIYNMSNEVNNLDYLNSLGAIARVASALRSESVVARSIAAMISVNLALPEAACNRVADMGAMKSILNELQAVISENPKQMVVEWKLFELLAAVYKLASSEINKHKLITSNILSLLIHVLKHEDEKCQELAMKTLWLMSFYDDNKYQMQCEPELLTELNRKRLGILWVLHFGHSNDGKKVEAEEVQDYLLAESSNSHIYISVEESETELAAPIKSRLEQHGFSVATFSEDGEGNYIDAISSLIENCSVLVMCISYRYKQHPEVRTEIEYALELGKPLIPILVGEGYSPDGWIQILMESNPYITSSLFLDMSNGGVIEGNYRRFEKEIAKFSISTASDYRPMSEIASTHDGSQDDIEETYQPMFSPDSNRDTTAEYQATSYSQQMSSQYPPNNVGNWTVDEVSQWVDTLNLSGYSDELKKFPGRYLIQLHQMQASAPEYFYQTLEKKLGLADVSDLLNFSSALTNLFQISQSGVSFTSRSSHLQSRNSMSLASQR